jgi:PKD repeat protein
MTTGTIEAYKNDVLAASPIYDVVPLTIQFKGIIISGTPTEVHWDFGDGTTSDILEPLHTFDSYGNHRVVMTLTDSGGTTTAPFFLVILGKLDFTADQVSGQRPLTVQFADASVAPEGCFFTGMIWDFGDGTTGMVQDPLHVYVEDDQYNVTLRSMLST